MVTYFSTRGGKRWLLVLYEYEMSSTRCAANAGYKLHAVRYQDSSSALRVYWLPSPPPHQPTLLESTVTSATTLLHTKSS